MIEDLLPFAEFTLVSIGIYYCITAVRNLVHLFRIDLIE